MGIFKEAPIKSLTRDRDAALLNRNRLALKLTEAEQAVIATWSAAPAAALAGNDAALDKAEASEGAAQRRHATILAAHDEAGRLLADLDGQLAALLDQKQRTTTAAEVVGLADDFLQAGESFEIAVSELVRISEKAARIVYEAKGLEIYSQSSKIEVPIAAQIIGEMLREYAKNVLNGSVPAVLTTPEAPFVPEVIIRPETKTVFTTTAISWREGDVVRVSGKFKDVELPPAYAAKALKARVAVEMNSPSRNPQTVNQWPGHPSEASCFSLDGDPPATDAAETRAIVQHSAFEIVDRGKPYLARVS